VSDPHSSKSRFTQFLNNRAEEARRAKDKKTAASEKDVSRTRRDWATFEGTPGTWKPQRTVPTLLRAFFGLLRNHKRAVTLSLVCLIAATLPGLAMPLFTKWAFDLVLAPGAAATPSVLTDLLPASPSGQLWALGLSMVLLAVVAAGIGTVGRYHMTRLQKVVTRQVRRRLFDHLARLPLHRIQSLKSGGVSSILRDDATGTGDMLFSVFYNPLRAIITFIGGLIALAIIDWRMLLGGLALGPAVWLSHRTWISRIRPVHRAAMKNRTMMDGHAVEAFAGIRIVRAFGRAAGESARYITNNNVIVRQEMLTWAWSRVLEVIWVILIPLASAAALVYGGTQVLDGRLSIGDVAAFIAYLMLLLGPLEVLVSTAAALQHGLACWDRCLDVFAEPAELGGAIEAAGSTAGGPAGGADLSPAHVRGEITFSNVSFAYPLSTGALGQPVLEGIDLTVRAGSTVALVGASGSGKSTLCNLVARFHDPVQGAILLDGRDLRTIRPQAYRSLLGIVEQDVFLFDGTIRDNIAYARRDATDDFVRAAATSANAHEFIENLEKQYDTIIGERGVRLSGGQKQRIAIARALLADPRILILDEATSSLDTHSERLIQAALTHLMRGRTCFVIAHRLSTIRHADQILVLDKGRIVERGTHEELVAAQGRYWDMLQSQLHASPDFDHAPAAADDDDEAEST
jgi:ATP-binding cassette subfamily B protein